MTGHRIDAEEWALVDHHVHGALRRAPTRTSFETALNEGTGEPPPSWLSYFDSQIGFAIRRWCAPLLDLPAHAPVDDYWNRRVELGETEVTRRFTGAAGVSDWLIDTGYLGDEILTPVEFGAVSGGRTHEIVRLETLAEQIAGSGIPVGGYVDAFAALLDSRTRSAVGVKSIAAYRCGFDIDWKRPGASEVERAAAAWAGSEAGPRLTDAVLIAHGVHAAADRGLPIQFHTGYGDRDIDLHRVNPILLTSLLRQPELNSVPVMLLHTYPFHREAGYLAQAFANVYFDVGLAVNFLGARAGALIEEALEVAPFGKLLYSSDAWGPAELHYLGARLWRAGLGRYLAARVDAGDWSAQDADRVALMTGRETALRVYGIQPG